MTLVKRIVVYLMVIAFIGAPLPQAFAQSATPECHTSIADFSPDVALHEATSKDVTAHKADNGKITSLNCGTNCLTQSNFMTVAFSLSFENWTEVFEPAVKVPLDGRTLKPELSPPIELI